MQIITTSDYPTRYVAQKKSGYLVQQLITTQQNGYELAAYSHSIGIDGVVAKITVCEDSFLAELEATRPSEKREYFNIIRSFPTYDEAESFFIEMIEEAERFVSI